MKIHNEPMPLQFLIRKAFPDLLPDIEKSSIKNSEIYQKLEYDLLANENIMLTTSGFELIVDQPDNSMIKCCEMLKVSSVTFKWAQVIATNSWDGQRSNVIRTSVESTDHWRDETISGSLAYKKFRALINAFNCGVRKYSTSIELSNAKHKCFNNMKIQFLFNLNSVPISEFPLIGGIGTLKALFLRMIDLTTLNCNIDNRVVALSISQRCDIYKLL
ncbi:hypothetical protein PV327_005105 [Microctonus hyperodae]|uniref:Uncharacterized protein n=1 Tax=Microctonus hyperodae TaxID=165561 RepID=A0AA39G154_MICHY|nr:hypothetical protein PV327_005105 [Microctonus hyperodae]